jgi:hypothetical protein
MALFDISTSSTADLLAFYNANSGKAPVARFSDRKTAERRVAALIEQLVPIAPAPAPAPVEKPAAKSAYVVGTCPSCGATQDITCGQVVERRGRQHVVNEHQALCHGCGHEFHYDTGRALPKRGAASTERGASIAASWKNPDVAARRAARHAVAVRFADGTTRAFRSTPEAFLVIGLPMGQMTKFRAALKLSGKADFGGFRFSIAQA